MSEDTREEMSETPRVEPPESPGRRLRRAREAAGLEVARVATELRLEGRTIEALEQDRYDRLPPAIFVRGYLRAYGELLELPVDELLEAHARLQPEEEQPLVGGEPIERSPGNGRIGLRVIMLVLLVLVVIGAVVWWLSGSPGHAVLGSGGSGGHPAHADKGGGGPAKTAFDGKMTVRHLAAPAAAGIAATPGPAPSFAATPSSAPSSVAAPERPVAGGAGRPDSKPDSALPHAPQAAPAAAGPQSVRSPDAAQSGGQGASARTTADHGAGATIPPARRVRLALKFRQKSWVEVHDARQKRLLYTLVPAGHQRTLVAEAPVHVFLGNAPGVRVTVNGQRYPTDSHTRPNNTARFVLQAQ